MIISGMLVPSLLFVAGTFFAGLFISGVQSLDYFPLIGKTTLSLHVYIELFHSAVFYRSLFFSLGISLAATFFAALIPLYWHSGFAGMLGVANGCISCCSSICRSRIL
jgi:putative spermidine/putrescine transport system permease protein